MASPIITIDKAKKNTDGADDVAVTASEDQSAQSSDAAAPTEKAAEAPPEGGKTPLKKPLGLSLRKPSGGMASVAISATETKPAPPTRSPIEEAIELALASASTAVDSAQEIQRLRTEVLERGNSRDPAESYRAFRGRDPSIEALLRNRGFTA